MKTFSFKTEMDHDVQTFTDVLKAVAPHATVYSEEFFIGPDKRWCGEWGVEVKTLLDLEQMRSIIRSIEDGHVMLQTLREVPLTQNRLERDFDAE